MGTKKENEDAEKVAAEKVAAEEKAAADRAAEAAKPKSEYLGKSLTVKVGKGKKAVEFKGLCIGERKTNSGDQVYLKIAGQVARFFSVKDIVK